MKDCRMKPVFLLLLLALASCKTDYANLPAFSATKQVQAVIETPAGAGYQGKYDPETKAFRTLQEAGQDKVIRFLPYPGNLGFIPSTRPPGDNDSQETLPVLVIAGSQPAGTVVEVMPIGVLLLEINEELKYLVIATPAKPSERLLEATTYDEFASRNQGAKKILETWFVSYNPTAKTRIMGWKDDTFADDLIRKWLK